jgi:hypothetical protein
MPRATWLPLADFFIFQALFPDLWFSSLAVYREHVRWSWVHFFPGKSHGNVQRNIETKPRLFQKKRNKVSFLIGRLET